MDRYHYLGYTPLPGAQMRYLVTSQRRVLAVVGFGASAWKAAPRDRFIGWSVAQREARLQLVVNKVRGHPRAHGSASVGSYPHIHRLVHPLPGPHRTLPPLPPPDLDMEGRVDNQRDTPPNTRLTVQPIGATAVLNQRAATP